MTDRITFLLSRDFILHADITNHRLGKQLTLHTQWLGAKQPTATQQQYSVTLNPQQLRQLGQHLKDQA